MMDGDHRAAAAAHWAGGGIFGGGRLSRETHAERSKNRNSSALSCGVNGGPAQLLGMSPGRASAGVQVAEDGLSAVLRRGLVPASLATGGRPPMGVTNERYFTYSIGRVVDPALRGRVDRGDALGDVVQLDLRTGERLHGPEPLIEDHALREGGVDVVGAVAALGAGAAEPGRDVLEVRRTGCS